MVLMSPDGTAQHGTAEGLVALREGSLQEGKQAPT